MIGNTITSPHEKHAPVRPARRFSEGMERIPPAPSTLRLGRFSDGTAPSLALPAVRLVSFADGLADRPTSSVPHRVGSFGDGYNAAPDRRPARQRRPSWAAPAHA
jgi:hypothetical protein